MISAFKGYQITLCMPECVSVERRNILEAFGANIILTDGQYKTDGSIKKACQIVSENPEKYYMPNQFCNINNILSHYETTGPEIYQQTKGEIDYLIAGLGTTGTIMGIGKYLKEKNSKIKIIGIEPVKGHSIQGLKNMVESIIPEIYNPEKLDDKIIVDDNEAFEVTRNLAINEGIFAGMSSGAALAGALKIAKKINKGNIVVIFPDRGDRYLSTSLFKSICAKCPP